MRLSVDYKRRRAAVVHSPFEPLVRPISLVSMVAPDHFDEIVSHLVATANAHHAATGGVNPKWARWYAEHLVDDLNSVLSSDIAVDELADWLAGADRRYRSEPQTSSWPKAYAVWLIEKYR